MQCCEIQCLNSAMNTNDSLIQTSEINLNIKLRLLQFLQMFLILIMNKKMPLHPNSRFYTMCISKRQNVILLLSSGNPNLFLDLKQSLEHAETKKYIFFSIILLRKINCLVSTTFTLEQKSGFKLERNKDLTCIGIIIDIDWYEKKYCDNFFLPISASPNYDCRCT